MIAQYATKSPGHPLASTIPQVIYRRLSSFLKMVKFIFERKDFAVADLRTVKKIIFLIFHTLSANFEDNSCPKIVAYNSAISQHFLENGLDSGKSFTDS